MRLLGTRLVYPLLTRRSIAASRGLPFRSTTQVAAASSPASTSRWNLLRPYQHDCVEAVLAAFAKGQRRVAISMPTGSGKTRIFSAIMPLLPAPRRGADKVLVLVNRTELLEQAVRALNETQAHLIVGMEAGPRRADVAACDVIVASVSSLGRESQAARRHRFDPADFKLIVIDEAHHTPAIVYQRILTHFGVGVKEETRLSDAATSTSASSLSMDTNSQALSPSSPPPRTAASQICVLGCTATLLRHDGIALNYYEDIVFQRTLEDMVSKKFLVPPTARKVDINVDLSDVRVLRGVGDYATDDLSIKLSDPLHTAAVVEQWKRLAWDAGRRSTLVFCVDVGHMMALEAKFRGAGVDARSVCGATPARERTQTLADFTRGDVPVLLNVAVLTEGTDLPCVDCIIFVRPTRSQGLFQQMLGRGLRLHPGKTDCLCVDLVGNFDRLSLEGEPTLSGLSMAAAAAAVGKALLKEAKRKERRSQSILAHAIENDLLTDNDAELTAEEKELPLAEGNAIATEADSTDAAATTTRRNELPSEEMTHAVQQWKTVVTEVDTAKERPGRMSWQMRQLLVRCVQKTPVYNLDGVGMFFFHAVYPPGHVLYRDTLKHNSAASTDVMISLIRVEGRGKSATYSLVKLPIHAKTLAQACAALESFMSHVYTYEYRRLLAILKMGSSAATEPQRKFAANLSRRHPSEFKTKAEASAVIRTIMTRSSFASALKQCGIALEVSEWQSW